ncbi:amino acid ABC transporter permease [Streptomyces sp. NPDC004237]|uniref:amino acid ABC transporter permease n=1 Tax=Streptomyces sp. NPDC004237 TaxID=3154455 RepID=UPI0033B4C077
MAAVSIDAKKTRELLPQVKIKHWGRWVTAAVILLLSAALVWGASHGNIDYAAVPGYLVDGSMLEGVLNTILLAIAAEGAAIVLGVIIALMRVSKNPVAQGFATVYTWAFRGMPVLVQILLWYNLALVFPRIQIGIPGTAIQFIDVNANSVMTAFMAAFLGLALNESAYMAEIVRAGLKSVDHGQVEAAQSIGETPWQRTRRIVLPQAMVVIIPPTSNNFINMMKSTTLASVIGFLELVKAANNISSFNLQVMETLLAVAIWYMVLVSVASVGQYYIERAFDSKGRRPGAAAGPRSLGRSLKRGLLRPPGMRNKA